MCKYDKESPHLFTARKTPTQHGSTLHNTSTPFVCSASTPSPAHTIPAKPISSIEATIAPVVGLLPRCRPEQNARLHKHWFSRPQALRPTVRPAMR
ncbi:hypothetical protein BU25DRAFT_32196 [Macroventuria anomochaeta]|uniref:Uncharacterized protein n=1 Tax=Macroventuria anomochaeta TaxID=301207 RepID=A0ACB6S424_9PLEO|nr:uncharacterized protein BU25DRAFT_32196 [Macroventuria anomochaeta]KAF2628788.1 hypothetical protein BU25DRAFT_32196 [Macroventuria anomochaeta]